MAKKNKKFVSNEAIHHSNSAASLLIKPPQVTKNPKKVNNVKRQQNCVQFKPNAMANQRLMSQQKLIDVKGTVGAKSSSQIQKASAAGIVTNRSKSPRVGKIYQSVVNDKVIKSSNQQQPQPNLKHKSASQSRQIQQKQPKSILQQPARNESAGTGEQSIQPNRSSSVLKHNASSSGSSYKRRKPVEEVSGFQQKATVSAAAPLKNSRSSFQLTFSRMGTTSQQQPNMLTAEPVAEKKEQSPEQISKGPINKILHARELRPTSDNILSANKKLASSHSPRDRRAVNALSSSRWSHLGEALRLYKVLQKKVSGPQDKQPGIIKPYVNVLSQHSKSVAAVPEKEAIRASSKTDPSAFQSLQESSFCSISQSQNRQKQVKEVKKILKNYQKKVLVPEKEKLKKQKRALNPDGGSHSPVNRSENISTNLLVQQQVASIGQHKDQEWREQKKRVKELRQQRKAIEAKTREIKLKSIKQQQQAHFQVQKKEARRTDLQSINNAGELQMKREMKTPQSYTAIRYNQVGTSTENKRDNELLSAVGFQKHFNMPLQLKPSRKDKQPQQVQLQQEEVQNVLPVRDRHCSTSSERVEWEPIYKTSAGNRPAPLRVKSGKMANRNGGKLGPKRPNEPSSNQILAMDLPMAVPKKIKTVTPKAVVQQQLPRGNENNKQRIQQAQSNYTTKKRVKETLPVNRGQHNDVISVQPRGILESDRKSLPIDRCIRIEELQSKYLRHHPQSIDPNQITIVDANLDSERQGPSKEKQKKLVEQSKRLWQQKEREREISQLNEQQRILKNLHHLNKVARHQAQKATKQVRQKETHLQPRQDKVMKSARSNVAGRGLERFNNKQNQSTDIVVAEMPHAAHRCQRSSSEEIPVYASNVKKDERGDKQDQPLNLHISAISNQRPQAVSQKSSARTKAMHIAGTTGGLDSSEQQNHGPGSEGIISGGRKNQQLTEQQLQRNMIKRNATMHQQDKLMPKDQSPNLNPVTLYQLQNKNGLTFNHDNNRRHSSLSQRAGRADLSQSSNLNYSPTTTLEKRSNSHSTQQRDSSASKSRGRRSRKQKSQQSSKKSAVSKRRRDRMSVVNRFAQSKKIRQIRGAQQQERAQKQSLEQADQNSFDVLHQSMDKDDLVVYIILTQAARMIQKAFRAYIARKRHAWSRQQLRNEVENELQEARIGRAKRSSNNSPVVSQLRKHTFSFGQQHQPIKDAGRSIDSERSGQCLDGSGGTAVRDQDSRTHMVELIEDEEEDENGLYGTNQETASFELQRNVQLDLSKMQLPITAVLNPDGNQINIGRSSNQNDSPQYGSSPERDEAEDEESMLYFEQVVNNRTDGGEQLAYETVQKSQASAAEDQHHVLLIANQEPSFEYLPSQCSEEGRSHIIAEAGEDISLQNILDDPQQKKAVDDSMMGSVALRTDNIINDSGALNTSEDMIDNMVNVSGSLGIINPYSIVSSASKHQPQPQPQLQQVSQQASKLPQPTSGKSQSDESSFEYPAMLLGNQYNLDSAIRKQRKTSAEPGVHASDQSRRKVMRLISGDERFLNSYSSRLPYQSNNANIKDEYTNTETQKEALQIISQLNSAGGGGTTGVQNQSLDDYQLKMMDNSFQNAFYPNCMQSSLGLQQNLSQVTFEQEESKDSLSLLKQNGINHQAYASDQQSNYFLHTNASIFDRSPFQDFTASKINALVNGPKRNSSGSATNSRTGSVDMNGVDQLFQMREDALKYITQLEKGWIARQEKLQLLSPNQSHRKRYELEQWVNLQRKVQPNGADTPPSDEADAYKPSAAQVKHFCNQVKQILETVQKKADEIREQLYQRSQDALVKKQQIDGYHEMHVYKKALGIGQKGNVLGGAVEEPSGEIKSLENIDVIDQSAEVLEEIDAIEEVKNQRVEENKNELEISVDPSEDAEMQSPPKIESRLNADILPTPPSETEAKSDSQSLESDANERLTEEITDRILTQFLQEELSSVDLRRVFERNLARTIKNNENSAKVRPISPSKGGRVRGDPVLEVAVTSDSNFNINQSISCDQIVAGVDTSLDAVEQYVEGIFAQIRTRAPQFMNAFYTPIYKNPLVVLAKIQKQGLVQPGNQTGSSNQNDPTADLSNTLSSILNVQLYLTLEKARENIIRDALQQIKDAAAEDQDFAVDSNLSELLSESDHIHNKAIFDAVNEALNMVRPYGRFGEPMPWSFRPRKNFFPFANEKDLESVLGNVKQCILDWATIRAGQISHNVVKQLEENSPSKHENTKEEQAVDGAKDADKSGQKSEAALIKQTAFRQLGEETLALQRERSLAKLLTSEIKIQEERWLDYEAEETQVKLDVADHLLEFLIEEVVADLGDLEKNKLSKTD